MLHTTGVRRAEMLRMVLVTPYRAPVETPKSQGLTENLTFCKL